MTSPTRRYTIEDPPVYHIPATPSSHVPLQSLLSRLRYPASVHRKGMAAWGPDGQSGRLSAWVKWDGKAVSAEFTQASPSGGEDTLSMRWGVSENGEAFLKLSQDRSGPIDRSAALRRFASIDPADTPSFITLPPPTRVPRP